MRSVVKRKSAHARDKMTFEKSWFYPPPRDHTPKARTVGYGSTRALKLPEQYQKCNKQGCAILCAGAYCSRHSARTTLTA